jgi:hypothetical protein
MYTIKRFFRVENLVIFSDGPKYRDVSTSVVVCDNDIGFFLSAVRGEREFF